MAEFQSLVDLFEKSCEAYAGNELFGTKKDSGWQWITYGEFKSLVDRFRGGLAAMGVGHGDRVGIVADNRVEWAVAAYATYGLKAQFVPMYQAQKPEEWAFILGDCDAKIAIGATRKIAEDLRGLDLPKMEAVICLEGSADEENSFENVLAKGEGNPTPAQHPDPADLAGFIYTSGTTGQPKGVKLSHGNICSNVNGIHALFTFDPSDRSLSFLPWAHSFGQTCELHGLLSMGSSMAINDDIPNLVGNLADVKPTILFAVPRIFNRIYDGVNKQMTERGGFVQNLFNAGIAAASKKNDGESLGFMEGIKLTVADKLVFSKVRARFGGRLKYAISGSAALNRDVAKFIDALGIDVFEGYGLTETSPIATANYPGHAKIGSVGKAIPGVRIVIDKEVTGDAENGEILVYGPNVMQGYHNRDDENKKVLMDDGGFRTGDMGRVDADGYVYITGRIKEQYKLENGKYVVPSPLEEELKLSPFISNAMLYGANKPHNVVLIIPDAATLEPWCKENGVDFATAASNDKVVKLIEAEIAAHSKSFKRYELPKKVLLSMEEFSTDNGMLTPTLKLKRRVVMQEYGDRIEALFK